MHTTMKGLLIHMETLTIGAAAALAVAQSNNIVSGTATAPLRGVYEVVMSAKAAPANPFFGEHVKVTFTRPDGSSVNVDGFFDGGTTFKARAYCDKPGSWSWASVSSVEGLAGNRGSFQVSATGLKGKLRKHPGDPRQFAYESGDWYLHIGDTGYRYLHPESSNWRKYIDQAVLIGATKIRTWFNSGRYDVAGLFTTDRKSFSLTYWKTMEERIIYALNAYPSVILQLIPYGEDTGELLRYEKGDAASKAVARYSQARWSSFPNICWCISNDRDMSTVATAVNKIGIDMAAREPWKTLITNHQKRESGYSFVKAPWSDIITLETIDEINGAAVESYRKQGDDPVVMEEDRYETYKPPRHPRYWFRHFMWSNLLSGGHPTFGGLNSWADPVAGYIDSRLPGALDFVQIKKFFAESGATLNGMTPDDALVGSKPSEWKCIHNADRYIVYCGNAQGGSIIDWTVGTDVPSVNITLPTGDYVVQWFNPSSGMWTNAPQCQGGARAFKAPSGGDWVLYVKRAGMTDVAIPPVKVRSLMQADVDGRRFDLQGRHNETSPQSSNHCATGVRIVTSTDRFVHSGRKGDVEFGQHR